jgi:probable rRNA maturation factor
MKKSLRVDVFNRQRLLPVSAAAIKRLAMRVFRSEAEKKLSGQVNICFVEDHCIKKLNRCFLGKAFATDVLAFESSCVKTATQADIIVSTQTAIRNSAIFKTTPGYEMRLYVVHGILHILGFNDNNIHARVLMRKTENKYVY